MFEKKFFQKFFQLPQNLLRIFTTTEERLAQLIDAPDFIEDIAARRGLIFGADKTLESPSV